MELLTACWHKGEDSLKSDNINNRAGGGGPRVKSWLHKLSPCVLSFLSTQHHIISGSSGGTEHGEKYRAMWTSEVLS